MIKIEGLKKSFGENQVLKGVDLTVSPAKITAILGPNGSGKTTLIKSILGMVIPEEGRIAINDKDIIGKSHYRRDINYLPQTPRFPDNLKLKELVNMIKDLRSQPTDEKGLVQIFGLEPYLEKRLRTLSGGTRQKVNVMLALMYDNPLIIMDEPTVGLDPIALLNLKELIMREKSASKTLLFTTHIMSLVEELADEIVFLLEGRIHFNGELEKMKNAHDAESLEKSIAMILKNQEYA